MALTRASGKFTVSYYFSVPDDDKRYELAGGVLYETPAPSIEHQ